MANPLLDNGRAYDRFAANPVGTSQVSSMTSAEGRPFYPLTGRFQQIMEGVDSAGRPKHNYGMDVLGFAGSLAGPMSKLVNMRNMIGAKNLLNQGTMPREVLLRTGYWQNPQGQMMSEISDHNMMLRVDENPLGKGLKTDKFYRQVNAENLRGQNLSDIVEHPEFFAHYPDMKGVRVRNDVNPGASGSWDPWKHQINLAPGWMPTNEMARILGHEMTHATQSFNGWRNGSFPSEHLSANYWNTVKQSGQANDSFRQLANSKGVNFADQAELLSFAQRAAEGSFLPKDPKFIQYAKYLAEFPEAKKLLSEAGKLLMQKKQMELKADQAYRNVTGEVEALAVERRLNMLPYTRLRGRPFWEDYAVRPLDQTPGKILPWMGGKP